MRDAFEITLLDVSGQPLTLPFSLDHEASFNWSEGVAPIAGASVQSVYLATRLGIYGHVQSGRLTRRNRSSGSNQTGQYDRDENSSVILRRIETIASNAPAPGGMAISSRTTASRRRISIADSW